MGQAQVQLTPREVAQIITEHSRLCQPLVNELELILQLKTPRMLLDMTTGSLTIDYGKKTTRELHLEETIRELVTLCKRKLGQTTDEEEEGTERTS